MHRPDLHRYSSHHQADGPSHTSNPPTAGVELGTIREAVSNLSAHPPPSATRSTASPSSAPAPSWGDALWSRVEWRYVRWPHSLHCDDAGGGRGLGLTRRFTGLVPLP